MGLAPKTYDLKAVHLVIGGYLISGYGADGGIEFEFGAPVGEFSVGADGQGTFSRNNDPSMTATITVMETSRAYRDLATLARAQAAATPIPALSFLCRDTVNGDSVSDPNAIFVETPAPSKGKAAGERVFVIVLPNGREDATYGELIAL